MFSLYHLYGMRQTIGRCSRGGHTTMMQTCPKCGFSQPQDRYCANCGLDIESYKPRPPSFFSKLRKNTTIHIFVLVSLIVLMALYVYDLEKEKILKHFQQNQTFVAVSSQKDKSTETIEVPTAETAQNPQVNEPPQALPNSSPTMNPAINKANAPKKDIQISFAELSLTQINELTNQGQILSENANRRSVQLSQIESIDKILEKDPVANMLPGGILQNFKNNALVALNFTHISGQQNADVGLDMDLSVENYTEQTVDLKISGFLTLNGESGNPIPSQEIAARYNFNPQNTVMIIGVLPRQNIKKEDVELFSNTPLAIYNSDEFISGLTDFVIFIQFK